MGNIDFKIIIPARYGSSRFPGKPLAKLNGLEMILHVVRQASKTSCEVFVATDDKRIFDTVETAGYSAIMTSPTHKSGTDRIWEAYSKLPHTENDVIINVQGDEPFIHPSQITTLMDLFSQEECDIATLARKFDKSKGFEAIFDPNVVKVAFDKNNSALYFSRSIIPYVRNYKWQEWLDHAEFYTHLGIYGYRAKVLGEITSLPQSSLELAESLEQLRWLQAGYKIKVSITPYQTIGIDTPKDLEAAEQYMKNLNANG